MVLNLNDAFEQAEGDKLLVEQQKLFKTAVIKMQLFHVRGR